jgi:polysaccharide deacetylase family protein (PEP-CTERM system associated)
LTRPPVAEILAALRLVVRMEDEEPVLLSFDFEDWHQLVHRRLGLPEWDKPRAPFVRQVSAALDFLDEVEATSTFFLLGMTARCYPELVREVVARGHEVACHGFGHGRVSSLTRAEFRSDVERSTAIIEDVTGNRPTGYRAPAFSLTRDTVWAYGILVDLGFRWDSSQYDSPRIPRRFGGIPTHPYLLTEPSGASLLEIPLAVRPVVGFPVPLGGGSYWRVLPARIVARALAGGDEGSAALYFHPYEFDPEPLRLDLPRHCSAKQRALAVYQRARWNPGRRHLRATLRRVSRECRLMSYEHGLEGVLRKHGRDTRALSEDGVLV